MFEILNDSDKTAYVFFVQAVVIIFTALPNVLIDVLFQHARDTHVTDMVYRNLLNVTQILVGIVYVYIMLEHFNTLARHFQITLPGMFFPGMFFSLQYGLIRDIHRNVKVLLGYKLYSKR